MEDRLRALSVSEEDYRAWQSSRAARKPGEVEIADIRVADTMKRVNPEVIENEIKQKPTKIEAGIEERLIREAERTQVETLQRELTTVFGRGDFERLDYSLTDDKGKKIITVEGIEKSWGPNYFKFGIGYATDFKSEQRFSAAFMYRMTWLNSLGAEWRTDARIGYIDELYTEFYQPFSRRVGVFAAPWVDLKKSTHQLLPRRRLGRAIRCRHLPRRARSGRAGKAGRAARGVLPGEAEDGRQVRNPVRYACRQTGAGV